MAKKKKARKPQAKVAKQDVTAKKLPEIPKPVLYAVGILAVLAIAALLWYGSPALQAPASPPAFATGPSTTPSGPVFTVIKDPSCSLCNSNNVADVISASFTGITVRELDASAAEAQQLISELGIKALPAYIFDSAAASEENFSKFEPALRASGGNYVLDERVRGLIVKYFDPPLVEGEPATADSADVTIIEFADPACSACRTFALSTKPMLEATYGDKIRFVFKSMPLSESTVNASIAMDCAGEQGKFWEYLTKVYQDGIEPTSLDGYAAQLGLNATQFANCTQSQKYFDEVMGDRAEGVEYGVSGTPTLFINGIRITGVPADEDMRSIVDVELAG